MKNTLKFFGAILFLVTVLVNLKLVVQYPRSGAFFLKNLELACLVANAEEGETICGDSWSDQGWTTGDIAWSGDGICGGFGTL